jgi:GRIP domain
LLLESFRIYRKKAKEIFEAQQQQQQQSGLPSAMTMSLASQASADAKLSYLKNLMMNYFTSDPAVRDHMLAAIGTVLQFTPDEQKRIKNAKQQDSTSWF